MRFDVSTHIDLKEIHYDNHNKFWDRSRQLNTIRRYLKQSYDSLNDEYQKTYFGTRGSLGSSTACLLFFFFSQRECLKI